MFRRALSALGNYLTEPGDRNLLGFKVHTAHEPKSLWEHWASTKPLPKQPPPVFFYQPSPPEPEPPRVVYIERPALPPPEPEPKPLPPPPPTRQELMERIEEDYYEDIDMIEMLDDPLEKQAALLQARNKRRRRIAQLIG